MVCYTRIEAFVLVWQYCLRVEFRYTIQTPLLNGFFIGWGLGVPDEILAGCLLMVFGPPGLMMQNIMPTTKTVHRE